MRVGPSLHVRHKLFLQVSKRVFPSINYT